MRNRGLACGVCQVKDAVCKGRCRTCYEYRRQHGEDRPVRILSRYLLRYRGQLSMTPDERYALWRSLT